MELPSQLKPRSDNSAPIEYAELGTNMLKSSLKWVHTTQCIQGRCATDLATAADVIGLRTVAEMPPCG